MGRDKIRIDLQRPPKLGLGLFEEAEFGEGVAEVADREEEPGIELDGEAELDRGLFGPPEFQQGHAPIVAGRREIGRLCQDAVILGDGLWIVAGLMQGIAQVVAQLGIVGKKIDGDSKPREGLARALRSEEEYAEVIEGVGEGGLDRQGSDVLGLGLRDPAGVIERGTPAVVGVGILGTKGRHRREKPNGFLGAAGLAILKVNREVEIEKDVAGIASLASSEQGRRLLVLAEKNEGFAQAFDGDRRQRPGVVSSGEGPELVQVLMSHGVADLHPERVGVDRVGQVAKLRWSGGVFERSPVVEGGCERSRRRSGPESFCGLADGKRST